VAQTSMMKNVFSIECLFVQA